MISLEQGNLTSSGIPERTHKMDEIQFNKKLNELLKEITMMPESKQKKLKDLADETKKRHKTLKTNIEKVNRSLIDLRICIKYLLFDLEATRRERDKLKAIIENDNDSPNKTEGGM